MRPASLIALFGIISLSPCRIAHAERVFKANPTPDKVYPRFHVGVTGIYATVEKGLLVTVDGTEPDTPAAGKFEKGDLILAVNGKRLEGTDPLVALGEAIGAAEASDGKLVFAMKRGEEEVEAALTIPVLGAHSKTWPLNCKKSQTVIHQTAEYIVKSKMLERPGLCQYLAALFLLSTGDDLYLPTVKVFAQLVPPDRVGSHTWNNGYHGILLGEYFLRTGDTSVLPTLEAICDDSKERQYYGGWNHWGGCGPGYVQGGLMNPAGAQILTTLILAKECGVEVDQGTLERALRLFYRFAGHGAVPYGDHRPEGWLSANGKNGMLTCALSLLDNDACRKAAQHMALDVTDSYSWLLCGHTGGGFDVIWRGLGSVHLPADKQDHYRRQMDKLAWHYDLSRLPKGGFSMVGGGRYGGQLWGTGGMGLAYTAPLRTLRITGGPRRRHSRPVGVTGRPWGRPRDLDFLRTDYCEGFGEVELEPHEVYAKLGDAYSKPSDAQPADTRFLAKMMRHYNAVARTMAARALGRLGAIDEIVSALQHPDPRVRRAGFDAITIYHFWSGGGERGGPSPAVVSEKCLNMIVKTLKDPEASLWELDGALLALGAAEPTDVAVNLDLALPFLTHKEWWLRQAAWLGLWALSEDEKLIEPVLPALFDCAVKEAHVMPRRTYMSRLHRLLKQKDTTRGLRKQLVAGMLRAMNETAIGTGYTSAIGLNNTYETLRFFLAEAPEAAPQVVDALPRILPGLNNTMYTWVFTGDVWNNPGLVKSAQRLGKEADPVIAGLREMLPALRERMEQAKKARSRGLKQLKVAVEEVARLTDPEMRWRVLLPISKDEPQQWRYVTWNGERPKLNASGLTRISAAPPPDGMEDWALPEFDDSGWKTARGAFGVWKAFFNYQGEQFTTEMTADHILLRKSFQLEDADLPILRLTIVSRDAAEVYLNGQKVYATDEAASRPKYRTVALDAKTGEALRKGENTLAVYARVNYWLQKPYGLIDAGLEGAKKIP